MAINATAIWRVRPSGANTNGGAYDPGIAGAATDYSQQNSAQYSASDGALTATTTTFTSAGAGFTSAMVGNAIQMASGTHVTAGFYFITGFTNSTTVTIDRDCSTGGNASSVVFKVGGALGGGSPWIVGDSTRATGNKMVAGNTVYILGSGGSPDYSYTGIAANPPVPGDTTNGKCRWLKDPNSTANPTINRTDGDLIFANSGSNIQFQGLVFKGSSASNNRYFDAGTNWLFRDCTFNLNDLASDGVRPGNGCVFLNCEWFSKTSGTPTARTGNFCIDGGSNSGVLVIGCNFHDLGCVGVRSTNGVIILNSVFSSTNQTSQAHYLQFTSGGGSSGPVVINCTLDKTADDACNIDTTATFSQTTLLNNIFSNNTGAAKFGVNVAAGSTAVNDRSKQVEDFNDYFNNTTDVQNFTKGANDLGLDPQYASEPSNLTLAGNNLRTKAYPNAAITGNTNEQSYYDLGALQTNVPPVGQIVKVASIGTY